MMETEKDVVSNDDETQLSEEHLEKFRELVNTGEQYEASSVESLESESEMEDEEDEKEYFEEELVEADKTHIIKLVVMLPFNNRWNLIQQLMVVVECCIILALIGVNRFTKSPCVYDMWILTMLDVGFCIDFFLSFIYKNWKSLNITQIHKPKPVWRFALDILSIIPFDQMYNNFSPKFNCGLFSVLSLNRLLRLNFMYLYVAKNRRSMSEKSVFVRIFEYAAIFTVLAHMAIPLLLLNEECNISNLNACRNTWLQYFLTDEHYPGGAIQIPIQTKVHIYWVSIYVILARLTTHGLGGEMPWKSIYDYTVFSILSILAIFMHFVVVIITFTQITVHKRKTIEEFRLNEAVILKYLEEQNVDKNVINRVKQNYGVCWKKFEGVRGSTQLSFIPNAAVRGFSVDLYWAAFQHSHMIRGMDVAVLRVLGTYCRPYFFLPGDIIYKKHELKSKMIYIVKGVLQIVSEEDDETPIISLSGGTCLGDISLVLSMKSTTVLKCATYCELYILNRKSYCSTLNSYPYHQKSLFNYTMNRLKQAKYLHSMSNFLKTERTTHYYDETRMRWFKKTLADLMKRTHQKVKKEETHEEVYFASDHSIYQNVQYTAAYLDLYVLAEKLEWESERACLTEKWPLILHPYSSFSKLWTKFTLFLILLVAFIIPQNAFYTKSRSTQLAVSILSGVFLLDIYIQITTAIITQDKFIVKMKNIVYLKFKSLQFIVDIIGSLPIELSAYIIYDDIDVNGYLCFLQLNRLILLYKVHKYLNTLENSLHTPKTFLRVFRYMLHSLILIYFYACVLFGLTCYTYDYCNQYGWLRCWIFYTTNKTDFIIPFYFSTMILTGLSMRDIEPTSIMDINVVILGFVLSVFLHIYCQSGFNAYALLVRKHWFAFCEVVRRVEKYMVSREIDKRIQKRVLSCLEMEWSHNKATVIFRGNILSGMPDHLKDDIQIDMCANVLRHVKLFEDVPENFITTLATHVKITLVPAKEIVIYAGTVNQEMYIVLNGFCEVLSNEDNSVLRVIGPNSDLSGVEMCLDIPEQHTVRTVTTCNILSLHSNQFQRVLSEFPDLDNEFRTLIKNMQEIKNQFIELNTTTYQEIQNDSEKSNRKPSFHYFGSLSRSTSVKWKDYLAPFRKSPVLYIFMIFLMRVTFHPDGTFIKVWELFRIIIAASSCILFPVHIILISTGYNIFWYIKFMLDGMAYLDLYIRLHSCYYNEKGLLITHPLKTAAHYLKNGFLIDFLGCVPLELFFIRSNVYQYNVRSYIVYNRLLQFLRIMSGISYANQNVKTPWFYQFVKYIPLLFIVINFMGTLLVKQYCDFHPSIPASENFTAGVTCPGKNWITTSDYAKNERPLTPLKVYLLGIYFAISLITTQGLPGIKAQNLNDCLVFSIFAFLGFFFIILFTALLAASRTTKNTDLVSYQEEMKSLNHFMQKRQIPFDVRKYTIDYFETFWLSKRGTTSHGLLDSFHSSLKFDALYNVYSSSINLHCVLSGATNRSFYHTILNLAVPEFYVKKVSICQVNDITDKFYILHKGRVEVKAVNGNRLVVLTAGAIFGNIKYSSQSRITVNFYPMGQVEVLVFSTMQFYKIIECYPIMKRRFAHITKLHTDFIPPNPIGQFEDLDKIRYTNTSKSASFASSLFQIKLIQPDAFYYKIWEVWTLIIGCYITFVFVIYQFCVQDGKIVLFCIGYFFDLCYAIRPYLKLRLPFENEVGEMVTRKALIRRRYFHSKLGLLLDIITIPPIELIAVFFTHKWLFYCTLLRLNRLPRILVIYDFFEARKNKLNIHVFWMRFTFVLLWNFLVLHALICVQIMCLCMFQSFCKHVQAYYTDSFEHLYVMIAYDIIGMSSTTTFVNILPHRTSLLSYYCIAAIICYYNGAIFMGEICTIMEMITYNLMDYINKINEIKSTMKKNKMSAFMTIRIWYYVCLLWDHQRGHQYPKLLMNAPNHLREKVNMCIYEKYLKQCYIFSSCEDDLVRQMVGKMKEFTFFPGNYITYEGDIDESMYFILEGKIYVVLEGKDTNTTLKTLHENDVFGLVQGLHSEIPHAFTYIAKTRTVIIVLKRTNWEYLLDFFPASRQSLLQRADLLLKKESEDFGYY